MGTNDKQREEAIEAAEEFFRGDAYVEISQAFACGGDGLTHAVNKITSLMADFALQYSGWVEIKSEGLPKVEGHYLTARRTENGYDVGELFLWFNEEGKHWAAGGDGYPDDFQGVTHWQSLPPAPFVPEGSKGESHGR